MRTIDEYMKLPYKLEVVEDQEAGSYVASFPELKGCITFADTLEETAALARDAKRERLAAALEQAYPIPEPASSENYPGQIKPKLP